MNNSEKFKKNKSKIQLMGLFLLIGYSIFLITPQIKNSKAINEEFSTEIFEGFESLKVSELPSSEKNRLDRKGDWIYKDRRLATLPLLKNNEFDMLPLLKKNEMFNITFGGLKGYQYSITLNVKTYLNSTEILSENTGDLDLRLFSSKDKYLIATSTNSEGINEFINFRCEIEDNYTIVVLHDLRDSTKEYATGSLKINTYNPNNFIYRSYFEGRTMKNKPTIFSNWTFYSNIDIKGTFVCSTPELDFYSIRHYNNISSEIPSQIDNAQTYGSNMSLYDWNNEYNINYIEIEAEWGQGFATIASTTKQAICQICNSQNDFILGNELNLDLALVIKNTDYVSPDVNGIYILKPNGDRIDIGSNINGNSLHINKLVFTPDNIGTYTIQAKYEFYPEDSYQNLTVFNVVNGIDTNPEIIHSGYYGPSELDIYQVYFRINSTGNQILNAKLLYKDNENDAFKEKELLWLIDDFYGLWLEDINNIEEVYWKINFVKTINNGTKGSVFPITIVIASIFITTMANRKILRKSNRKNTS